MAGAGTDEMTLLAILCTADNALIHEIADEYSRKYRRTLETAIQKDTSGKLERLLTILVQGRRDPETTPIDAQQVDDDVEAFYKAAKGFGTDEATFFRLLGSRSRKHLAAVAARYPQLKKGKELDDVIKSEFSGKLEDACRFLLLGSIRMGKVVAKLIRHAVKGAGTDDDLLILTVIQHHDTAAMRDASIEYESKYGKTLARAIKGDTSGNYERALLATCHVA
jgi:annexin A7/11